MYYPCIDSGFGGRSISRHHSGHSTEQRDGVGGVASGGGIGGSGQSLVHLPRAQGPQ